MRHIEGVSIITRTKKFRFELVLANLFLFQELFNEYRKLVSWANTHGCYIFFLDGRNLGGVEGTKTQIIRANLPEHMYSI